MSSSFVELNSPDLLFVTLAVVEGCVQRVGHVLAVVQLANSATHLLKKILFKRILTDSWCPSKTAPQESTSFHTLPDFKGKLQ